MNYLHYIDKLKARLAPYYDVQEDVEYEGYDCDVYARFFMKDDRYVVSKKVVIYSIERNQHLFVKYIEHVDEVDIEEMERHLDKVAKNWVEPDEDHMSTFVRGIIVTDGPIAPEVISKIKKYKFEKGFLFGIHGWVYNGINLVDLNDPKNFIHNRRGKEDREFFVFE